MRLHRSQLPASLLPLISLLFPSSSSAASFDCNHVRVDGRSFDLSSLGGPHSVMTSFLSPPSWTNTTWTIDICKPLKKKKGVDDEDQCHTGTQVCGIVTIDNPHDTKEPIVQEAIPIAGNFINWNGRSLDPKFTRLKATDSDLEGLSLEMHGGVYPFEGPKKNRKEQMAVIQFICDPDKTGLEGEEDEEKKLRTRKNSGKGMGDDPEEGGKEDEDDENSLRFISYEMEDDVKVLKLDWHTKVACESKKDRDKDDGRDNSGSHWGFFTWFIVIAFLGTAAYLIFGSWLNYNRYGARGWDLLPHGDTIRDIPYIFNDWVRRIISTVQGPGSRGGYSAV